MFLLVVIQLVRNGRSKQALSSTKIDSSILARLTKLMWKESVNALTKFVGFLRVLRCPPTGNVDRVGLGLAPN